MPTLYRHPHWGGRMCSFCLSHALRATPYCANKRCLYLFGCHKQTDCGKSSRGWKVVRGVVEPEAPSHTLGDSHEEEQCECANEQQDRIPAGSSDWLEAAFGSRATGNSCCGTMHNKQKFKACRTWAASSSIPLSSDPVGCGSELMPPFFVNVEGEPPDNSHLDATGKFWCWIATKDGCGAAATNILCILACTISYLF